MGHVPICEERVLKEAEMDSQRRASSADDDWSMPDWRENEKITENMCNKDRDLAAFNTSREPWGADQMVGQWL